MLTRVSWDLFRCGRKRGKRAHSLFAGGSDGLMVMDDGRAKASLDQAIRGRGEGRLI